MKNKVKAAAKENDVQIIRETPKKKFMTVNLNLPLIAGENIFIFLFFLKKVISKSLPISQLLPVIKLLPISKLLPK